MYIYICTHTHTRCDQQVPRLIFLLGLGTLRNTRLLGGVLGLPLSLGQGMIPARLCPSWASVEESCAPVPYYCSCRVGRRKTKSSVCAYFDLKLGINGAETFKMLRTASVSSAWAVLAFSNGARDLKKAETQLSIRGNADRLKGKLCCASARTARSKSALNNPWTLSRLECLEELAILSHIWTCDLLLQNLFSEFSPP